jgi:CHAT domain-containing protein
VKKEIDQLSALLGGRPLLDASYTVARLRQEVIGGNYNFVHLATHGVFGPSAATTYVMAYDDLLTLDRLQELLRTRTSQSPIELLTLSACQTAEGDDRAPMGLSGAAIQARVGSVLGSLWPVNDEAANRLMNQFYRQLLKQGNKAQALRASQLALLAEEGLMRHPYFWAPFILVGDGQ